MTKYEEQRKQKKIDRKLKLVKLKGHKCSACGYQKNLAALVFHHKDPAQKRLKLSVDVIASRKWEIIIKEAKKCVLLCVNCHSKKHISFEIHSRFPKEGTCLFCGNPVFVPMKKYCSKTCQRNFLMKRKMKNRREKIIRMKGGECSICEEKDLRCLTLHHMKHKNFPLSARNLTRKWDSILKEADKCVLLCANCHAEEHYPHLEMEFLKD